MKQFINKITLGIRRWWRLLFAQRTLRVWQLGSMEHHIFPTRDAIDKLADILRHQTDTTMDMIWGPELTVTELRGADATNVIVGKGVVVTEVDGNIRVDAATTQRD